MNGFHTKFFAKLYSRCVDLHLKIYKIGNKSIYRMLLLLPDTMYNRNVNHMRVVRMDNAGGDVYGPILT